MTLNAKTLASGAGWYVQDVICAAVNLRLSDKAISTVDYEAGFNDLSTFNRRFRELMGVSPGAYRRAEGR